jgi:serine/threonine protein kinase
LLCYADAALPCFVTGNYPDEAQHETTPSGVRLIRLLGAGAYGNLYIGHVTEPDLLASHQWWSKTAAAAVSAKHCSRPAVIAVYAKVLAPDAAVPGAREIDRLRQLDHPNIVRLVTVLGASTEATDFHQRPTSCCLLYEYIDHGIDLVQYLTTVGRQTPASRCNHHNNLSSSTVSSTDWRCLVAMQVATALVYLSSRGLVHRDVAARNVIVSNPRRRRLPTFSTDDEDENTECEDNVLIDTFSTLPTAKLSDFSLSRRPYSGDYIPLTMRGDGRMEEDVCRLVPLRWSAPEAVNGGRHSEATDSWSFGVLLWELYIGVGQERPHDTIDDDQLLDVITTAGRPPSLRLDTDGKPAEGTVVPSFVLDLIVDCGDKVPAHRPRFLEIVDRFRQVASTNQPPCSTPSHSNGTSPDGGSTAHLLQIPSSSTLPRSAQTIARVVTTPTSTTPNSPTAVVRSGSGDGAGAHRQQLTQRSLATGGNGWPAPPPAAWWAASPTPSARRLNFGTSTPPEISGLVTASTSSSSSPHPLQSHHPHHQHQQQQQHQPHPQHYQLQQPTRMHDVVL